MVVDIVSNQKGNEDGSRLREYAALTILYYVIYDPQRLLSRKVVRVYQLVADEYLLRPDFNLPAVELSLTYWYGRSRTKPPSGCAGLTPRGVIHTGAERAQPEHRPAEKERQRVDTEGQRAEDERQRAEAANRRAEQAHLRAERLAAQLRALGVDPNRFDRPNDVDEMNG